MKILEPRVFDDLQAGRPLKIDLGSGGEGRYGHYGVDLLPLPGVAIQANLNEPLDALPDNSVGELISSHCMEHVAEFLPLMAEIYRVVRPGGRIEIVVPHFSDPYGYSDPTHVRFFGLYSFYYFVDTDKQPARKVPCFYSKARFEISSIRLRLRSRSLLKRLMYPRLGLLVNKSIAWQDWWERRLCWSMPADEIGYLLTPVK
jgi:SAM-dependent methyltransferase